ncbi:MAG TPA: right-handed parallel beta-helix repeat-containing protein [bacterium]|nr:right-handed parallel beta-helix repeat-containing protein [bacterium]
MAFLLLSLPVLSRAFPFWLNSPSRRNPNDPQSSGFAAAHFSPVPTGSNTVSPSQTPTFTMSDTATDSPTITPSFTNTPFETPTPSVTASATPTSTPTSTQVVIGAALPYDEYEAEAATSYTGTLIGPNTKMSINGGNLASEIAAESSGREGVSLTAGESITFSTIHQCNSIVVRYIIPDAAGGGGISATLSCYVNGTFNQELNMTSMYNWDYGSNMNYTTSGGVNVPGYNKTPGGDAFHLYDETHALLNEEVAAGSTITLEVGASDTAKYYIIDFIDLEDVAAPLTMPAGFVSITSSPYNAVASPYGAYSAGTGAVDCTTAIQDCLNANSEVWIPQGNFSCLGAGTGKTLNVPAGVTVEGAGMWYSGLSGYYATLNLSGSNTVFSNFYLDGDTTNRDDNSPDCGFNNGGGTGSSITDVWVEHEKCGYWMNKGSAVSNGMTITGCRFRDLYADGVNMNQGASNCLVTQCNLRNTGDDSLAAWSTGASDVNDTFSFNTVQNPWRADCFALYGGTSNVIENNICSDTLDQSGVMVDQGFSSEAFAGNSVIQNNDIIRAGALFGGSQYGAVDLWGNDFGLAGAFTFLDNLIQSSTYMAVEFNGNDSSNGTSGHDASGATFTGTTINNAGSWAVQVMSGTSGTATFNTTTVNSPGSGNTVNSGTMTLNGDP